MFIISYFVGGVLHPFLALMLLGMVLEPRWTKRPHWYYVGIATLILQIPTIIRAYVGTKSEVGYYLATVQLALMILIVLVLFRNKIWAKLFGVMLWYLTAVISEFTTLAMLGEGVADVNLTGNSIEGLVINLLATSVQMTLLGILTVLWKTIVKKNAVPRNILLFFMFPLGQILMLDYWTMQVMMGLAKFRVNFLMLLGLIVGFVGDVFLFYIMFRQGEKEEMKRHLRETENFMETERKYYQVLKDGQEEMSRIRHDFNNQLTVALHIIESGEHDMADTMIKQLQENIAQSNEEVWCDNDVVNAVLADKSRMCEREGMKFTAEAVVPKELPVSQLHLCSLISNLIDAAIKEAKMISEAFVQVKIILKDNVLNVNVNSASEDAKGSRIDSDSKYGAEIVKNIVDTYNGTYERKQEKGVNLVMVTLKV